MQHIVLRLWCGEIEGRIMRRHMTEGQCIYSQASHTSLLRHSGELSLGIHCPRNHRPRFSLMLQKSCVPGLPSWFPLSNHSQELHLSFFVVVLFKPLSLASLSFISLLVFKDNCSSWYKCILIQPNSYLILRQVRNSTLISSRGKSPCTPTGREVGWKEESGSIVEKVKGQTEHR